MAVQIKDEVQELLDRIGEDLDLSKESLEIMESMLEDIRDNVENGDEVVASLKDLRWRRLPFLLLMAMKRDLRAALPDC